jgi:hypothetical protein
MTVYRWFQQVLRMSTDLNNNTLSNDQSGDSVSPCSIRMASKSRARTGRAETEYQQPEQNKQGLEKAERIMNSGEAFG